MKVFDAASLSIVIKRHEAFKEMLEALKFVDRLYSTTKGSLDGGYSLRSNSNECGAMIDAVRKAIDKAEDSMKERRR